MAEPTPAAQNRLPLILGIGAGVLLVLFLATQLFGGDDGEDATTDTTAPVTTAAPAPVPPTTVPGTPPAETFESFTTKNPFLPLRITAAAGGGAGGPSSGGAAPPPAGSGATGGTAAPGGSTAAPAGAVGGGAPTAPRQSGAGRTSTEPRRGARVALLDVFVEGGRLVASVRVNDTVHKVGEGQVFASSFKVVSLSQADSCGRFLFGDDAFRLCKGEEALK